MGSLAGRAPPLASRIRRCPSASNLTLIPPCQISVPTSLGQEHNAFLSVKPRLLAKVGELLLDSAWGSGCGLGQGEKPSPPLVWRIPALPLLLSPGTPQPPYGVEPQARWWARRRDTYCRAGHEESRPRAPDTLV